MNGDWFWATYYVDFDDGGKATERYSPGNFKQWIFTESKTFTRVGIKNVNLYDHPPF